MTRFQKYFKVVREQNSPKGAVNRPNKRIITRLFEESKKSKKESKSKETRPKTSLSKKAKNISFHKVNQV